MNIEIKQNQALIKLTHNDGNLYWIQGKNLEELSSEDYSDLLKQFNKIAKEKDIEIQSDTTTKYEKINSFLNKTKFKIAKRKLLVFKKLNTHIKIEKNKFEYQSVSKFSEEEVFNIFSEVIKGDSDMNLGAKEEFNDLIEMTEDESYKEDWKVVLKDDKTIGLVLPYKYLDDTNEGTLLYIGLVPEFRNKGFAQEIHSQGLQFLKEIGIETYYGSTMKNNKAMLSVFEKNQCEIENEQLFYKAAKAAS